MSALNFPNSPSNGDTYSANGLTYTYNSSSTKWVRTSPSVGAQGATGPTGAQGAAGAQGATAAQGAQGAAGAQGATGSATITANADNRIITGGSGTNLVGESTLTYDGNDLTQTTNANGEGIKINGGNNSTSLTFDANRSGANNGLGNVYGRWNGTTVAQISFNAGSDTTDKNDGYIYFGTESAASNGNVNATERLRIDGRGNLFLRSASANYLVMGSSGDATSGGVTNNMNWIRGNQTNTQYNTAGGFHGFEVSGSEKFRINNTGHVTINDGDLVIGTSGHGIDFSVTSDGSGTSNRSELLDDYEEGSFTPTMSVEGQGSNASLALAIGTYTKVGAMVNIWIEAQFNGTPSGRSTSNAWQFGGLPFSSQPYTVPPSGLRDYRFPMIAMGLDTSSTYGSNGHFVFRLFDNQTAGRIEWQHSDLELKNASLFIQNGTMIQIHACYPDF